MNVFRMFAVRINIYHSTLYTYSQTYNMYILCFFDAEKVEPRFLNARIVGHQADEVEKINK